MTQKTIFGKKTHVNSKCQYSGHLLSQAPTGSAKKFEIGNVQNSGKFNIFNFLKALGKPNTVFSFVLPLVSLKGNMRQKTYRYFYSQSDIVLSVKISPNTKVFSGLVTHKQ